MPRRRRGLGGLPGRAEGHERRRLGLVGERRRQRLGARGPGGHRGVHLRITRAATSSPTRATPASTERDPRCSSTLVRPSPSSPGRTVARPASQADSTTHGAARSAGVELVGVERAVRHPQRARTAGSPAGGCRGPRRAPRRRRPARARTAAVVAPVPVSSSAPAQAACTRRASSSAPCSPGPATDTTCGRRTTDGVAGPQPGGRAGGDDGRQPGPRRQQAPRQQHQRGRWRTRRAARRRPHRASSRASSRCRPASRMLRTASRRWAAGRCGVASASRSARTRRTSSSTSAAGARSPAARPPGRRDDGQPPAAVPDVADEDGAGGADGGPDSARRGPAPPSGPSPSCLPRAPRRGPGCRAGGRRRGCAAGAASRRRPGHPRGRGPPPRSAAARPAARRCARRRGADAGQPGGDRAGPLDHRRSTSPGLACARRPRARSGPAPRRAPPRRCAGPASRTGSGSEPSSASPRRTSAAARPVVAVQRGQGPHLADVQPRRQRVGGPHRRGQGQRRVELAARAQPALGGEHVGRPGQVRAPLGPAGLGERVGPRRQLPERRAAAARRPSRRGPRARTAARGAPPCAASGGCRAGRTRAPRRGRTPVRGPASPPRQGALRADQLGLGEVLEQPASRASGRPGPGPRRRRRAGPPRAAPGPGRAAWPGAGSGQVAAACRSWRRSPGGSGRPGSRRSPGCAAPSTRASRPRPGRRRPRQRSSPRRRARGAGARGAARRG